MTKQGLTRTGLGRFMGYEESTFRGIMKGKNILRRNRELIKNFIELVVDGNMAPQDFLKPQETVQGVGLPSTGDEASALGITGNEKPVFSKDVLEKRVQNILKTAQSLELQLEPFLIEGGIGDRRLLRVKTNKILPRLLTLLRGASSEAVCKKMITDNPDIFKK